MPCSLLIVAALALAPSPSTTAAEDPTRTDMPTPSTTRGQPVSAVLLRPTKVDAAVLLEALQLRSPQRTIAAPPWPDAPGDRFGLFAVATVGFANDAVEVTVVLSDGRAYYRTLEASSGDAPRLAASAIANLLAAIEEDELPPDEEDVPLPPEHEPEPEPTTEPAPASEPSPAPRPAKPTPAPLPLEPEPLELETVAAGTLGAAMGPPTPAGFMGGGGLLGLELRWPRGPIASLTARSHWHRPDPLVVGRTRLSLGGGYAWRRGRFELRTVAALDIEPWGVRRDGSREPVLYPNGVQRGRGLQLGGHLRITPAWRLALGPRLALRVGPRLELGGSALAQAPGIARLLVTDSTGTNRAVTRVGGLEISAGFELGLAWSLPPRG